jgi:ribonuclease P protein component
MTKFRALFSFGKKEIALFFTRSSFVAQINGMKLLAERHRASDQPAVEHGKLLVVTSRKVGKACVRNRLRRQVKAIYYEHNLVEAPLRLVLICYPQATELSFDEIKKFLTTSIRHLIPTKS